MVSRGCSVCGGGGDTCNCLVVAGDNIGVAGVGSTEFPYIISAPDVPKAQKVWCGADGIPIGYSLVDKDGVQEFFLSNGSFAGLILPDGWEECKCVCQSGGGGTLYPDWQTLVINGLGELALAYDGVETVYIKNANVTAEKIDLSVADAAARDAIASPWEGLTVYVKDIDAFQTYTGSRWKWSSHKILGANTKTTTSTLLTTSYATHNTVTADSLGGEVEITFNTVIRNAGSGGGNNANVKIVLDGVTDVTPIINQLTADLGAPNESNVVSFTVRHTPSAGSHTWTLQANANANSSVYIDQSTIRVVEVS